MTLLEAIILGLLQGLTEFIPVSSSGHVVLAQTFFSGAGDHLFLEWVNIGTFVALLVFFRKRIIEIIRDVFYNKRYRLARNILLTSVPAGAVGYFFSDYISGAAFFASASTVVVTLSVVGIIMIFLEKIPRLSDVKDGEALTKTRAFLVGAAQMVALIPGVSRSGSTIIAGRLLGLSAKEAAEYSFLASLPIMAGVTLKLLIDHESLAYFSLNASAVVVSNIVAFVSGILAVGFLMRYLAKHSLELFGWYRVGLAVVVLSVLLLQ